MLRLTAPLGSPLRLIGSGLKSEARLIAASKPADDHCNRRLADSTKPKAEHEWSIRIGCLPAAFHSATHSGTLLKIMLAGTDNLFGLWLAFFREHLSTFVAVLALLPLSLYLNWRLGLLLIALILLCVRIVCLWLMLLLLVLLVVWV